MHETIEGVLEASAIEAEFTKVVVATEGRLLARISGDDRRGVLHMRGPPIDWGETPRGHGDML